MPQPDLREIIKEEKFFATAMQAKFGFEISLVP